MSPRYVRSSTICQFYIVELPFGWERQFKDDGTVFYIEYVQFRFLLTI